MNRWRDYIQDYAIDVALPVIDSTTKVMALGSCFAEEIKNVLIAKSIDVYPKIFTDNPDKNILCYTPMSILQEVQLAFGDKKRDDDIWYYENDGIYQDPFRRHIYDKSKEGLQAIIDIMDNRMWEGFQSADVFIFTFGHIEAWKTNRGNWACIEPQDMDDKKATLAVLSFTDCLAAISAIANIIKSNKPNAKIVFTVSPVPLRLTYRDIHIAIANCESKSTLRAAVGTVSRIYDLCYFPSYELATSLGRQAFKDDGRHIKPEVVADIMKRFFGEET